MRKPFVELGDLAGPEGNVFVILGRVQRAVGREVMDTINARIHQLGVKYENVLTEILPDYVQLHYVTVDGDDIYID